MNKKQTFIALIPFLLGVILPLVISEYSQWFFLTATFGAVLTLPMFSYFIERNEKKAAL